MPTGTAGTFDQMGDAEYDAGSLRAWRAQRDAGADVGPRVCRVFLFALCL